MFKVNFEHISDFFSSIFIINTRLFFINNASLKSFAKNQAKAKQHPEAELFAFLIHVIIQECTKMYKKQVRKNVRKTSSSV